MRILPVLSLLAVLATSFAGAQTTSTNLLTPAQALKLASGLKRDMLDRDVTKFLESHGLSGGLMHFGDGNNWGNSYPLSGHCRLDLDFRRNPAKKLGDFDNGLLEKASIRSNAVTIINIKLVPRP